MWCINSCDTSSKTEKKGGVTNNCKVKCVYKIVDSSTHFGIHVIEETLFVIDNTDISQALLGLLKVPFLFPICYCFVKGVYFFLIIIGIMMNHIFTKCRNCKFAILK